jgi:hypothetical protein
MSYKKIKGGVWEIGRNPQAAGSNPVVGSNDPKTVTKTTPKNLDPVEHQRE